MDCEYVQYANESSEIFVNLLIVTKKKSMRTFRSSSPTILLVCILIVLTVFTTSKPNNLLRNKNINVDLNHSQRRLNNDDTIQLLVQFTSSNKHFSSSSNSIIQTYLGQNTYTIKTTVGEIEK
jgi:hypothetical protein